MDCKKIPKGSFFCKLSKKAGETRQGHREVAAEMAQVTIRRLHHTTKVFIPLQAIYLYFFGKAPVFTPAQSIWRMSLLLSHGLLLLCIVTLFFVTMRLKKRELITTGTWLAIYSGFAVVMGAGVILAVIDQLVTSSITPFLVACTFAALLFLINPLHLLFCYLGAFGLYYWAIGLTQSDSAILLSNRINGFTAISIGMILAIVLWKKTAETIRQERLITLQQKELARKNLELEIKNKELESFASFDTLTNLYNRRLMQHLADQELRQAKRNRHPLSMLIVDIDRFKNINDQFGHPVGDKLLIQLAELFKAKLRESDVTARWGGEEFLVLLPKAGLDEAVLIAENLRKAVESECFHALPHLVRLTVSIGVSTLDPSREDPFFAAYCEADQALYLAKEQGRNLVRTIQDSPPGRR